MRNPLDSVTVTGPFGEVAVPGTGLPDSSGVKRHIGVDLRAPVGTPIYAPANGTVVQSYINTSTGLQVIEATIDGKTHRFLHLSERLVINGQSFSEGQVIAKSGNSGGVQAHLHWDVRKAGTTYNSSLYNYYDPMTLITKEDIMDTDDKVKAQYYTLRGSEGTVAERKGWIGKSYEAFNAVARPEVDGREAHRRNLESAIGVLTKERDASRAEAESLRKEVLGLSDQVKVLQGQIIAKDAEIAGQVEAQKKLIEMHNTQIDELNKVIAIKDSEIKKLNEELAGCSDKYTGWQLLLIAIKKIIGGK